MLEQELGLISFPGVCTPTEAFAAIRAGADGLKAPFPDLSVCSLCPSVYMLMHRPFPESSFRPTSSKHGEQFCQELHVLCLLDARWHVSYVGFSLTRYDSSVVSRRSVHRKHGSIPRGNLQSAAVGDSTLLHRYAGWCEWFRSWHGPIPSR